MKQLFILAALWATMIVAVAGIQVALGFGTPNVVDGESIIGFWAFLWALSFVSVPMGIMLAVSVGYVCKAAIGVVSGR